MAVKLWRQYAVGIAVTFSNFITTIAIGWSSPSQGILQNATTSPLGYALTGEELAIVNSAFILPSLFGPILCGALVPILSCRQVLLLALGTQLVGSILVALALDLLTIIIGRIILGLGCTVISSCVIIFISEITTEDTRGIVSTFITLCTTCSLLYAYSLGAFVSYYVFNSVNVCIVAAHMVVLYLLSESPAYLIRKGDREGAIKSLTKIRGRDVFDLDLEFPKQNQEEIKSKWFNPGVFTDKANLKVIFLGSTLIGFQSMIGSTIVVVYMMFIFEVSGSKVTPAVAAIIVVAFAVASCIVASLIVSRIRRKVMLMTSYSIAILNTVTLGIYFKLDNDGWNLRSTLGYLPLVTVIMFTVAANVGIVPVTYAAISELITPETKTIVSTFSMTISVFFGFLLIRLFSILMAAIGAHGLFFMSSGFSLLLLLIVIFVLPETKGKTAEELRALLM